MSTHKALRKKEYIHPIDEDLVRDQTNQLLQKYGLNNHLESLSLSFISKEVIRNKNKKLLPLKAYINIKSSPAWIDAFFLAMAFLSKYNMIQTIETIKTEFDDKEIPNDEGIYDPQLIQEYFQELFLISDNLKSQSFENKLDSFIEDLKYEDSYQLSPMAFTPLKSSK